MSSVGSISDIPIFGSSDSISSPKTTNKEDFLKLLVAQLRFQDPMNPLEGTDFAAQLAQFSQVEELQNINSKIDSQNESNQLLALSVNNTLATTLIGKTVRAAVNTVRFDGSDATIRYSLPSFASPVNVSITNEFGTVIRAITVSNAAKGDNSVVWDGRDNRGNRVPEGDYTVSITGTNTSGVMITATPILIGRIEGVRFENGTPTLLINGRQVSFGAVLDILETEDSGGSLLSRLLEASN